MADLGNTAVISPTDASNGSGTHPSWLGSAAPSTIDDAGRALQGAVAREWQNRSFAVTSSGSADAYVVAYTVAPAAYRTGQVYSFITNFTVAGTATVNINSLGAKTIKKDVAGTMTALSSGDMSSGQFVMLAYNGTDMIWVNWQGAGTSAASTTAAGTSELLTTTEVLTGTDTTRTATADSIAALWEAGADITDGAAITIGEGAYFNLITSTTAITSFSITTDKAGRSFRVRFNTIRTLTHNATSLIIPGGANITTAAGDIAFIRSLGSGNVVVEAYTKADGTAIVGAGLAAASQAEQETGTSTLVAVTPGRQHFHASAAKFWVKATANSTTIVVSYNMTSWADTDVGIATGTIATDFSGTGWCGLVSLTANGTALNWTTDDAGAGGFTAMAAGTFEVSSSSANEGGAVSVVEPGSWMAVGFGDI